MRFILFFFLSVTLTALMAQPCHTNVDVTNIRISYSSNNGTSIQGNFTNLSPNRFKAEYRNLTDNGRWKTETNFTYGADRRWTIHGLQPAKEYKVRIFVLYYGRWCEVDMHHIWTYLNTADFTLNGQNSGTVSICGPAPIIMNAAVSRYEDSYGIAIREVNAQNQGVGNEMHVEYNCEAPNGIDIRALARSRNFPLIGGKRYYVKLFTKPNWQEKMVFLDIAKATLSITPNASRVPNTTDQYYRCVGRNAPSLFVDTRASNCEVGYFLKVVEINNNQEVPGTLLEEWIDPTGSIPDQLNIADIYRQKGFGFQTGKKYQVVVAVGHPWAAQHFYVQFYSFRDCPSSRIEQSAVKPATRRGFGF